MSDISQRNKKQAEKYYENIVSSVKTCQDAIGFLSADNAVARAMCGHLIYRKGSATFEDVCKCRLEFEECITLSSKNISTQIVKTITYDGQRLDNGIRNRKCNDALEVLMITWGTLYSELPKEERRCGTRQRSGDIRPPKRFAVALFGWDREKEFEENRNLSFKDLRKRWEATVRRRSQRIREAKEKHASIYAFTVADGSAWRQRSTEIRNGKGRGKLYKKKNKEKRAAADPLPEPDPPETLPPTPALTTMTPEDIKKAHTSIDFTERNRTFVRNASKDIINEYAVFKYHVITNKKGDCTVVYTMDNLFTKTLKERIFHELNQKPFLKPEGNRGSRRLRVEAEDPNWLFGLGTSKTLAFYKCRPCTGAVKEVLGVMQEFCRMQQSSLIEYAGEHNMIPPGVSIPDAVQIFTDDLTGGGYGPHNDAGLLLCDDEIPDEHFKENPDLLNDRPVAGKRFTREDVQTYTSVLVFPRDIKELDELDDEVGQNQVYWIEDGERTKNNQTEAKDEDKLLEITTGKDTTHVQLLLSQGAFKHAVTKGKVTHAKNAKCSRIGMSFRATGIFQRTQAELEYRLGIKKKKPSDALGDYCYVNVISQGPGGCGMLPDEQIEMDQKDAPGQIYTWSQPIPVPVRLRGGENLNAHKNLEVTPGQGPTQAEEATCHPIPSSIKGLDLWPLIKVNDCVERSGSEVKVGLAEEFWKTNCSYPYLQRALRKGYRIVVKMDPNNVPEGLPDTVYHGPKTCPNDTSRYLAMGEEVDADWVCSQAYLTNKDRIHKPWSTVDRYLTDFVLRRAYRNELGGVQEGKPFFLFGSGGGGLKAGENPGWSLGSERAFCAKLSGLLARPQVFDSDQNLALLRFYSRQGVATVWVNTTGGQKTRHYGMWRMARLDICCEDEEDLEIRFSNGQFSVDEERFLRFRSQPHLRATMMHVPFHRTEPLKDCEVWESDSRSVYVDLKKGRKPRQPVAVDPEQRSEATSAIEDLKTAMVGTTNLLSGLPLAGLPGSVKKHVEDALAVLEALHPTGTQPLINASGPGAEGGTASTSSAPTRAGPMINRALGLTGGLSLRRSELLEDYHGEGGYFDLHVSPDRPDLDEDSSNDILQLPKGILLTPQAVRSLLVNLSGVGFARLLKENVNTKGELGVFSILDGDNWKMGEILRTKAMPMPVRTFDVTTQYLICATDSHEQRKNRTPEWAKENQGEFGELVHAAIITRLTGRPSAFHQMGKLQRGAQGVGDNNPRPPPPFYLPRVEHRRLLSRCIESWARPSTDRITDLLSGQFAASIPDELKTANGMNCFLDKMLDGRLPPFVEALLRCETRAAAVDAVAEFLKRCLSSTDGTWKSDQKMFVASVIVSDLHEMTQLFPADLNDWENAGIHFGYGSKTALTLLIRAAERAKGVPGKEISITAKVLKEKAKEALDFILEALLECSDAELGIMGLIKIEDALYILRDEKDPFRKIGYQDLEHMACKIFLVLVSQDVTRCHNNGRPVAPHTHPTKGVDKWPDAIFNIAKAAREAHRLYLAAAEGGIDGIFRHADEPPEELVLMWKKEPQWAGLTEESMKERREALELLWRENPQWDGWSEEDIALERTPNDVGRGGKRRATGATTSAKRRKRNGNTPARVHEPDDSEAESECDQRLRMRPPPPSGSERPARRANRPQSYAEV